MTEVLQILERGAGCSIQDSGRTGWKRFGVPASGVMDDHAAAWANRLIDNPIKAPVLEILLQGTKLKALQSVWIAITGADAYPNSPQWRAVHLEKDEEIYFSYLRKGVWSYLAIEGGFRAEKILGSASAYPRGQIGEKLERGSILQREESSRFDLPRGVRGRLVSPDERRDYDAPPPLKVWPGPQWNAFQPEELEALFSNVWMVSSQSDRVGYRLKGTPIRHRVPEQISEPVLVGTIQIPPSGEPLVTMRDGPTVGGYPKLGVLDSEHVSWLAQCRPGMAVRFEMDDKTIRAPVTIG